MRAPEFWARRGIASGLLLPFGLVYGAGTALRLARGARVRPGPPVICVGNLVAGGAGKTPVAIALVRRLHALGLSPHVLTRGYGGRLPGPVRVDLERHLAADVGDEALLLARAAPTWVSRHRGLGGRAAAEAGAELIVLDDGLQNPSLHHDLALVVIDTETGFGNRWVIPAGPLREPIERGLSRVHAAVLLGPENPTLAERLPWNLPRLGARLVPDPVAAQRLAGHAVHAFAGIGRPEKFFATLAAAGASVCAREAFPDHHPFERAEIEALIAAAEADEAPLVTTEKDHVRLPPDLRDRVSTLPVSVEWAEPEELDELLHRLTAAKV